MAHVGALLPARGCWLPVMSVPLRTLLFGQQLVKIVGRDLIPLFALLSLLVWLLFVAQSQEAQWRAQAGG